MYTKRDFEWLNKTAYLPIFLSFQGKKIALLLKGLRAKYSTVFLGNTFQCFHNLYSWENFLMSEVNPFYCSSVLVFWAL